jgi:hypothetical protein
MNNIEVSIFRNYKEPVPISTISLNEWLVNDEYKTEITVLRQTQDSELRKKIKTELPAITPSGIFSKRFKDGLLKHSGVICVDIDGISHIDLYKEVLSRKPYLYYCGLSVSGNGLFCIIPLAYPEKHEQQFYALQRDFASLGIIIDKSCKDVCRLRGISYDSSPYLNEKAVLYTDLYVPNKPPKQPVSGTDTAEKVNTLVRKIEAGNVDITGNYANWFEIGCALANEFGEGGRSLFHSISAISPKYRPDECDKQYYHCATNPYGYTIASLFHYAKINGIR